jgi:hypothetical protein
MDNQIFISGKTMRIGHINLIGVLTILVITLVAFYCVGINAIKSGGESLQSKQKLLEPHQNNLEKIVGETELSLVEAEKKIIAQKAELNNEHLKQSAKIAGNQLKLQFQEIITAVETLSNINSMQKNSIERKSRSTNPNGILLIPAVKQNYYQEVAFRSIQRKRQINKEQKRQNININQSRRNQNKENKTDTKITDEDKINNKETDKITSENSNAVIVVPSNSPSYCVKSLQLSLSPPAPKVASNSIVTKNQTEPKTEQNITPIQTTPKENPQNEITVDTNPIDETTVEVEKV